MYTASSRFADRGTKRFLWSGLGFFFPQATLMSLRRKTRRRKRPKRRRGRRKKRKKNTDGLATVCRSRHCVGVSLSCQCVARVLGMQCLFHSNPNVDVKLLSRKCSHRDLFRLHAKDRFLYFRSKTIFARVWSSS